MMDDSAPTHERRKLVKTYKNMLPQKRTVAAEVCGESIICFQKEIIPPQTIIPWYTIILFKT